MEITSHHHVYGVDFSGAKDAGKKIWIANGVVDGSTLRIDACYRAADLPGSAANRDRCLTALRDFIASQGDSAFGLDFPFGLPRALVEQERWEDFILAFPDEYPNPEAFRETCREAADGHELRRVTDRQSETPFSPYNLRLFRQTYYGIRDLLHPLVREGSACVLPMQSPSPDRPWVLEVCPASTLKQEGLYLSYKGRVEQHHRARIRILKALEETEALAIPEQAARSAILEDYNGDALDSVIAALATFRTLRDPVFPAVEANDVYALEGYVYV